MCMDDMTLVIVVVADRARDSNRYDTRNGEKASKSGDFYHFANLDGLK